MDVWKHINKRRNTWKYEASVLSMSTQKAGSSRIKKDSLILIILTPHFYVKLHETDLISIFDHLLYIDIIHSAMDKVIFFLNL